MDYAVPVAFTIAVWWLSTVVLLYRTGLPSSTFRATLLGASFVLVLAVGGLWFTRSDPSAAAAYIAFTSALAIWAWHEVSYFLGFINGPRALPCPPNVSSWRRFVFGVRASLYHELAIVATAAFIAIVTWQAVNQIALWTFVILWLMRWSAKLNIFLGVRNLHREYWPDHLRYLDSYARQKTMNGFFPVSILVACVALWVLGAAAVAAAGDPTGRTGAVLMATLLALAILEHCFLVLRVPDDALWKLGTRERNAAPVVSGELPP
ncbi:MAG TPA: putative photosynthetic complex assembly protein PuhE [Woeseiaceae bacterium]